MLSIPAQIPPKVSRCPPLPLLVQIGRNLARGPAAKWTGSFPWEAVIYHSAHPFGSVPPCSNSRATHGRCCPWPGRLSQRGSGRALSPRKDGGRVPLLSRAPASPASLSSRLQAAETQAGGRLRREAEGGVSEAPSAAFLGVQGADANRGRAARASPKGSRPLHSPSLSGSASRGRGRLKTPPSARWARTSPGQARAVWLGRAWWEEAGLGLAGRAVAPRCGQTPGLPPSPSGSREWSRPPDGRGGGGAFAACRDPAPPPPIGRLALDLPGRSRAASRRFPETFPGPGRSPARSPPAPRGPWSCRRRRWPGGAGGGGRARRELSVVLECPRGGWAAGRPGRGAGRRGGDRRRPGLPRRLPPHAGSGPPGLKRPSFPCGCTTDSRWRRMADPLLYINAAFLAYFSCASLSWADAGKRARAGERVPRQGGGLAVESRFCSVLGGCIAPNLPDLWCWSVFERLSANGFAGWGIISI